MKRKGLAILLAFCLVISLVPVLASADNKDVSRTIDVENQNIRLSVVVGGRLTVSSSKSDKDGDYIWEEVSNDSIVEKIAMKSGKDLILEGLRQGTAKFKLIVGNNETTFQVQVLSDEQGVSIVPDSVVVAVDGEKPLTASYSTGTIYERDDADFTWGSLKPSIADVDENGVVTGVAKGVTTVTAQTYQDGKLWSGACTVMVEDPHTIKYVKSENGELSGDEKSVRTGIVRVTASPNDNYRVSSIKVVRNDTGAVESSANLSGTGDKTWEFEMPNCNVTVSAEYAVIDEAKKPLKGISISEEEAEVPVKAQFALEIGYNPEDTSDSKEVVWETSNKTVATVADGVVTGIKEGKATIEATVGKYKKTCEVTVTPALDSVKASKQELTLVAGKEETLGVSYKTSDNDHLIAKWESDDPSIATVDPDTGKVTGRKVGETNITVTVGEESDTVKVVIKESEGDFRVAVDTSVKNGKVTSDKEYADKGDTVKLSVVPDDGYKLAEISATTVKEDDTDGEAVSVKGSGSSYSFVMPEANVVVQAKFEKTSTSRFVDVPSGIWYEEAVNYVADKGYLDGVGNNRFDPNGRVTRGQLCTILYAMEGKPLVTAGSVFPDVAASKYYYDPVRWAATNGMVAGYTDGTFKPEVYVSRQQLAAVLHKYTAYKGFDTSATANIKTFADYSSVSNYAVTPLSWAVSHKVMSGTNTNRLEPLNAATRAEFAVMLKAYDANVRK